MERGEAAAYLQSRQHLDPERALRWSRQALRSLGARFADQGAEGLWLLESERARLAPDLALADERKVVAQRKTADCP